MEEHSFYGKKKLCYTEVDDFTDIQGIGRDPLYKRWDSVFAVISKHIAPEYQDFLAQPLYLPDQDRIEWFSKEWTTPPQRYVDLDEVEKVRYKAVKDATLTYYANVLKKLQGEDSQILSGALKHIDDDFLFCLDGKVFVVAWGMLSDSIKHKGPGAVIHDLKIRNDRTILFNPTEKGGFAARIDSYIRRPDGSTLSARDIPMVIPHTGYRFKYWNPEPLGMRITSDVTFTAVYDEIPVERKFNVHFVAGEHGILEGRDSFEVEGGKVLDASNIPPVTALPGYEFTHWDSPVTSPITSDIVFTAVYSKTSCRVQFVCPEKGTLEGTAVREVPAGTVISPEMIPLVRPEKGFCFTGWNMAPLNLIVRDDVTFTAIMQPEKKSAWRWLRWILLALLLLLFLVLAALLFRRCDVSNIWAPVNPDEDDTTHIVEPIDTFMGDDGQIYDDNGSISNIIDDDGGLPDGTVVAPIFDGGDQAPVVTDPGVPGNPQVIANRLFILFDSNDVDLEAFARDLLFLYPDGEVQVIGCDRSIPFMQIMIPEAKRARIREELPGRLPAYSFIVMDETLIQENGTDGDDGDDMASTLEGWHLSAIHLKDAWNITKGSPDIVVAVVDDGIDASHELFTGRIVKPYNIFTGDNRLSTGRGHGTHVAGLAVGSDVKFSSGVSGVAPRCKLMPVQVFDNHTTTISALACGVMYAINNGADVVNISAGTELPELASYPISYQELIARSILLNEAKLWKKIADVAIRKNIVLVFAAGNSNILTLISPEKRTGATINVAAVDSDGRGAEFSNFGEGTDVSAPGKAIKSSVPVNSYDSMDGTSMAAPIVTGTVALMMSLDRDITRNQAVAILKATGMPVSSSIPPMVRVDRALKMLRDGTIPDGDGTDSGNRGNVNDRGGRSGGGNSSGDGGNVTDRDGRSGDGTDSGNRGNVTDRGGRSGGGTDTGPGGPGGNRGNSGNSGGNGNYDSRNHPDYDAIRRQIREYEQKIRDLKGQLPESSNRQSRQ